MLHQIQRALFIVALIGFATVAPLAWAGHGHGGHGHGHGGHGHGHGGHGHFSGHSHFGGHVHLGFGGLHYDWGHYHARPYYYYPYTYYRPYAVYPYSYYNDDGYYYSDTQPRRTYTVSRPPIDVARVEVRLPDAEGRVWIQGKEMSSSGSVRRFKSPTLDPSERYVYTIQAEWYDNGQLVAEERRVKVQANSLAVVDFTLPNENIRIGSRDRSGDVPPPQRP